jgi:hypothetical protein
MTHDTSKILHPSAVRTADGNTDEFSDVRSFGLVAFVLDVTNTGGTTPTLDVDIEYRDLASGKWVVIASFTQVTTSTGTERITVANLPEANIRVAWRTTGTSETYTFSVGMAARDL